MTYVRRRRCFHAASRGLHFWSCMVAFVFQSSSHQLGVSFGNYVVDPPRPALKLNADRADLDLIAAIANDNPIVVARLRVVLFALKQGPWPDGSAIRGKMKPRGLGQA